MARLLKWVSNEGLTVMLDGSTGVSVRRGAAGLDAPARALTIDQRVNAAGGVLIQERIPTQQIMLPIHVDLFTADLSALIRAFRTGTGTLVAGSGRELRNVVYESGLEGVWSIQAGGVEGVMHRQFNLDLTVLDPMWYGETKVYDLAFGSPTDWSPHEVWSPHLPWSGGTSQSLEVLGDEDVFPTWSAIGPLENLAVGLGSGRNWEVTANLTGGATSTDVITVDQRPGSRGPRYGSELIAGYPLSMINFGLITEASRVDWKLPKGTNSVVVGGGGTTAATRLVVSWEERWYTPWP